MSVDVTDIGPEMIRPFSRDEFLRLAGLGVFEGERVELLYGTIVRLEPMNPPHVWTTQRLGRLLDRLLDGRALVVIQSSYDASEASVPQPDVAVVPADADQDALPTRALLVVEVADASLKRDRRVKAPLYAQAGIGEYWLVNLVDKRVEVFRDPSGGKFRESSTAGVEDVLRPQAFPDVAVAVRDFLR